MRQPIPQRIISNFTAYLYDIILQLREQNKIMKEKRDAESIRQYIMKTNELNKTLNFLCGHVPLSTLVSMFDFQDLKDIR